jgi:NADH-quinone oxidoreductase subunit N
MLQNLGASAIVQLIARGGDRRTSVEDYNGIGFESVLAFSLTLLVSLLACRLPQDSWVRFLFGAAINQKYYILVVIGVLNTAVSAYYYLRLVIVMFFRERTTSWIARIPASIALAITSFVGLYLGIFPTHYQRPSN